MRPFPRGVLLPIRHDYGHNLIHLRPVSVNLAHGDPDGVVQSRVAAGLIGLVIEFSHSGKGNRYIAVGDLGIEQSQGEQIFDLILLGQAVDEARGAKQLGVSEPTIQERGQGEYEILVQLPGVDDPERRNRHWPAGFTPKQNPFYVALPYGEFTEQGDALKHNARHVPWYRSGLDPLLKNRWVEIRRNDRSCFAQWQDVGPCGEDDFDFVFGTANKPRNTFDAKAGLDVSPAVWHHLGMTDNGLSAWRLVEEADVPAGPWTEIVTRLGNNR